jgi:hypothetical protein
MLLPVFSASILSAPFLGAKRPFIWEQAFA